MVLQPASRHDCDYLTWCADEFIDVRVVVIFKIDEAALTNEDIQKARNVIESYRGTKFWECMGDYFAASPDDINFLAKARTGWPAALDAVESANMEISQGRLRLDRYRKLIDLARELTCEVGPGWSGTADELIAALEQK